MKNYIDQIEVVKTKLAFASQTLDDFARFIEADKNAPTKAGLVVLQMEHDAVTNYYLMVAGYINEARESLEEVKL